MFKKAFEMKNLLMTAAVGALILPSFGWSAADGRGHNGPNLAPTSIPVELDHGITAGRVLEAINVCYAEGDSRAGVVSLLQRLASQLTGGYAGIYDYYGKALEADKGRSFYGGGTIFKAEIEQRRRRKSSATDYLMAESGEGAKYGSSFKFRPNFTAFYDFESDFSDAITLQAPANMPSVKYRSVAEDSEYDEYGREAKSSRILMGVSIEFDPAVYGTSIKLINAKTNGKSAVTINTVEYVECLKSEIQKRGE